MLERFRASSSKQQAVTGGAVFLLICAALFLIWFWVFRVPYADLFTDLREADAAAITAELDKQKIPYRLAEQGSAIRVPVDMVDRTRLS